MSKPYFGAEANLAIGPSTYLLAYVDRTLAETTLTGASSDLETTVGARVDHDMNQDLSLNARLAYTRSAYQGITRDEDYVDGRIRRQVLHEPGPLHRGLTIASCYARQM